jgi:hypothetical protein
VTTRPRRHASGASASHSRPPASPTPPPQARGWCGPVLPLAPPGGRGIVVRNLHHGRTVARGRGSASDTDITTAVVVVATANTTVVVASTAAAAAVPSRCGLVATAVSRGGSPVATALATAHVALNDCRLVGMDVSDLSALAGARAGMVGMGLQTRNTKVNIDPSRSKTRGGNATHLRFEKPRFLFLEGSWGAPVAPAGATVALAGASAAPAGTSTDDPVAGASTCSEHGLTCH